MKERKLLLQTLHAHTTNSDGALTHGQLLKSCLKNGVGVVAFTDHDTVPSPSQIKALEAYRDFPVRYVYGVEFTSGYPQEIYSLDPKLFHIVGLFIDPFNKDIIKYSRGYKEVRRERLKLKIKEFAKLGFSITPEAVFSQVNAGGIPTSLNLVLALLRNPANAGMMGRYFSKLQKMSRTDKKAKTIYDDIVLDSRPEKQKYFGLFLKDDAPFKIELPEHKPAPMEQIVELIRNAGGVATLAHWSFDRDNVRRPLLKKLAGEGRVDGVETVYDLFTKETPTWKRKFQLDRAFLKKVAREYGLFTSGGVDAHREEDLKLFFEAEEYSRETIGMVQKIIASTNCEVKNSSLRRGVDF